MARFQLTVAQGQDLAKRIQDGEFNDDPQKLKMARLAVVDTARRANSEINDQAVLTEDEQDALEDVSQRDEEGGSAKVDLSELGGDLARRTFGAAQVAGTLAVSAIGEIVGGYAGMLSLAIHKDPELAAAEVRSWQDAFTFDPATATGEEMLRGAGEALQFIDTGANYLATLAGEDNPLAETIIYTGVMGGLDILGIKAGRTARLGKMAARRARLQALAEELGIKIDPANLSASIVESARNMSTSQRAANAPLLRKALLEAKDRAKQHANELAKRSQETKSFFNVKEAQKFASVAKRELADQFDLQSMPTLAKALDDLEQLNVRSPTDLTRPKGGGKTVVDNANVTVIKKAAAINERATARLLDLEIIRGRIQKKLAGREVSRNTPRIADENIALRQLDSKITNWLDQQFNSDMMSGDVRGVRRWKESGKAHAEYLKRFHEDRTLKQLMDRGATPDSINKWVFGSAATGARGATNAAQVINRLKEVLGPTHPAIKGIRQDFLYDIAMPLFDTPPNFKGFLRNYKNIDNMHPALVDALELDKGQLSKLRGFARAADAIGPTKGLVFDMAQSMSQFFFGHAISRKGLIVRTLTMPIRVTINMIKGATGSRKRALLADLVGAQFGGPAVPLGGAAAGRIIAGAFWSNPQRILENMDELSQSEVGN